MISNKITSDKLINRYIKEFGGIEEVRKLGKLKLLSEFTRPPYQLTLIKPWGKKLDLRAFGYELGEEIKVFNEKENQLLVTSIEPPSILINGEYYDKEGNILEEPIEDDVEDMEIPGLQEILNNTKHGDFLLVNFSDQFIILWLSKKLNSVEKEKILNRWRENFEEIKARRDDSRLGIKLQNYTFSQKLKVYILRKTGNNIKTAEQLKQHQEVFVLNLEHFKDSTFLYPDNNWWLAFEIEEEGYSSFLSVVDKQGRGMNNFRKVYRDLYAVELFKEDAFYDFPESRERKSQIKGTIFIDSTSPIP